MLRKSVFGVMLLCSGCGLTQGDFTTEYTAAWCDYLLACGDQSELTFDGILTAEDCVANYQTEVALMGAGCKYKAPAARQCIDALATTPACPLEGEPFESGLPAICDEVYVECSGEGDTTDAG